MKRCERVRNGFLRNHIHISCLGTDVFFEEPANKDLSKISGVRLNLGAWIQKLRCDGDVEKQWFFKNKFIDNLKHSKIALQTDKANEQHYEVPTDFFTTVRS